MVYVENFKIYSRGSPCVYLSAKQRSREQSNMLTQPADIAGSTRSHAANPIDRTFYNQQLNSSSPSELCLHMKKGQ